MPRYTNPKEIEQLVNSYLNKHEYNSDPSTWYPNPWDDITTTTWYHVIVTLFRRATAFPPEYPMPVGRLHTNYPTFEEAMR